MLKIRLQRVGRKHEPSFRLVLTDSKNSTKSGRLLEVLGSHDSRREDTNIKGDRVKYWMGVGAKATDTVHNLLLKHKIIEGKKINVLPKKTVPKKEEPIAETSAPSPMAETTPDPSLNQGGEVDTPAPEAEAPAPDPVKEEAPPAELTPEA